MVNIVDKNQYCTQTDLEQSKLYLEKKSQQSRPRSKTPNPYQLISLFPKSHSFPNVEVKDRGDARVGSASTVKSRRHSMNLTSYFPKKEPPKKDPPKKGLTLHWKWEKEKSKTPFETLVWNDALRPIKNPSLERIQQISSLYYINDEKIEFKINGKAIDFNVPDQARIKNDFGLGVEAYRQIFLSFFERGLFKEKLLLLGDSQKAFIDAVVNFHSEFYMVFEPTRISYLHIFLLNEKILKAIIEACSRKYLSSESTDPEIFLRELLIKPTLFFNSRTLEEIEDIFKNKEGFFKRNEVLIAEINILVERCKADLFSDLMRKLEPADLDAFKDSVISLAKKINTLKYYATTYKELYNEIAFALADLVLMQAPSASMLGRSIFCNKHPKLREQGFKEKNNPVVFYFVNGCSYRVEYKSKIENERIEFPVESVIYPCKDNKEKNSWEGDVTILKPIFKMDIDGDQIELKAAKKLVK